MSKMSKLVALVIFSCLGVSYGAEYDIKTITTTMDAYEKQVDSIKLKYSCTFPPDEQGNIEFVKGTFAQKKSEGYILLDEISQTSKTWTPSGIVRSYNGEVTRYLEHEKNKHGYHMAALHENHNPKLYETSNNPYYRFYRINCITKVTDLLNDPNRFVEIIGEEIVDGLTALKISLQKAGSDSKSHLWLLPEKNYLPIRYQTPVKVEGNEIYWQIKWGDFKKSDSGIWFPWKIQTKFSDLPEPTTIKTEEIDFSPLTKEDFEFEFPAFTHVTDHILGTSYLTTPY